MAGSSWPALTAGKKAKGSDVEAKFDWIEGSILPMNAGSTTTGTYNLGSSTATWAIGHIDTVLANTITADTAVISGTLTSDEIVLGTTTTRYYTVTPQDCIPTSEGTQYLLGSNALTSKNSSFSTQAFFAGVHLPQDAIVTDLKLYYYQADSAASIVCQLQRNNFSGSSDDIASLTDADVSSGYNSVESTSTAMTFTTIDNQGYSYRLYITLDDNDATGEVGFVGATISYTITKPLP